MEQHLVYVAFSFEFFCNHMNAKTAAITAYFQNSQNRNTLLFHFLPVSFCRLSVTWFLAQDNWRLFLVPETGAKNRCQKMVNVSSTSIQIALYCVF